MKEWQLHEEWLSSYPYPLFILDKHGCVEESNEALNRLTSYDREELREKPFAELVISKHQKRFQTALSQAGTGDIRSIEVDIMDKNDRRKSLQMILSLFKSRDDDQPHIHVISRNITSNQILKRELIQSKLQLEHLFESLDVAIWSVDAKSGKLLHLSLGAEKVYGHPVHSFYDDPNIWKSLVYAEDLPKVNSVQEQLRNGRALVHEYRIVRGDNDIRWIHDRTIPELNSNGELITLTGIAVDITEQKLMKEQIHQLAYYDTPTSLPNRAMLEKRASEHIKAQDTKGSPMAIISLEAIQLHFIADTLGHDLADEALRQFAERAAECMPSAELISRIGDHTLGIVSAVTSGEQELHLELQHFFSALEHKFHSGPYEFILSAAAGISMYPHDGTDSKTLLKHASAAMRRTKKMGSNIVRRYTTNIEDESYRTFLLEKDLHDALLRDEFVLHYQPQVNLQTNEFVGVEALLRWNHRELGMILPADFFTFAEETNLIIPIGEWVLRTACSQYRQWKQMGLAPLRIGVNISSQQILQHDFAGKVMKILAESDMDPRWLELEVTENTFMQSKQIHILKTLQDQGISIAIDDFGTGYSSLQNMNQCKANVIKLDKMFVQPVTRHEADKAIVDAVINLVHKLGMKVVAEGVETKEQLDVLKCLHCDEGQGYLYGLPVPADGFTPLLQQRKKEHGLTPSKAIR